MARRGRPRGDIAIDLGRSRCSVHRWLDADLERGLDGPTPREAKGAVPELAPDLAPVLRQWVIDGPAERGLDRANWTYAELATTPPRPWASGSASRPCKRSGPSTASGRTGRRPDSSGATRPSKRPPGRIRRR